MVWWSLVVAAEVAPSTIIPAPMVAQQVRREWEEQETPMETPALIAGAEMGAAVVVAEPPQEELAGAAVWEAALEIQSDRQSFMVPA